ncbi:MAG: PP2C family protein-serine/threonine phosphatase [Candidatus Azotimanducaceae bacterium]
MTIKTTIVLIILAGFCLVFGANFYSSNLLNEANQEYSSDNSLQSYTSAWFSNMDIQFENKLLIYDPLEGMAANADLWDPELDSFNGTNGANPLFEALQGKDAESAEAFFGKIFSDPIFEEQITFAVAYDQRGLQLYCESSLYVVGVDPCSQSAQPDYFLNFGSFVKSLDDGSSRSVIKIKDLSNEKPVSINDTLAFSLKDENEKALAVIVLGRNVIDSLEQFSENFEIETAIALDDNALTVYDYYEEEKPEILKKLVRVGLNHGMTNEVYQYSFIDKASSYQITSIPFSKSIRASDLRILIFADQAELITSLKDTEKQTIIFFLFLTVLITAVVFLVTSASFNRITGAIQVLEKMADGDLSANTQKARSVFSSDRDEVGRLQRSIESYRQHRIEAEEDRINRAKRRDERDEIMFEKMTLLSDQLEGQSKDMLLTEISEMKEALSTGDDETKETASIELMSRAFSKMSDEVNALIAARTHELVEARDEISSSIRYAARLQNALLPKSFPGDFTINVEWRPRDLVGGDIYFIKDLPDKVYIAVVDCTGHGVPGAFLSIIARSQLEKAIDEEHYQSAGQYLSMVNDLLRETLSKADQSNMGEEGFDGGVCIYFRKEQRLEFAGAKASIFNVDSDKADEVAGDRKSVGSTRMASDFQFTTHVIEKNEGAFVMLTDGITDVMSPEERPIAFGRRRVLKILRESVNASPGSIVSNIMTSVDLYRGGAPLRDDLTLLAFSMKSESSPKEVGEVVGDET